MKKNFSTLFATLIVIGLACSSSEKLTNTKTSNSIYPAWYSSFAFTSDNTTFYARATAVASNPETAKQRAELEARAFLESYIAKEIEDIRYELERDGMKGMNAPDFILKLRNAHAKVESEASVVNSSATETDGIFRGFVRVSISKKKVEELMKSELNATDFVASQSFIEFLGTSN